MDPDTDPDRNIGKMALAEVCTVPVLLLGYYYFSKLGCIGSVIVE